MWFGKPAYCLMAFLTTEISAVALLFITMLAQVTPNIQNMGPLTPQAMIILAYASMIGVVVGGVVQVLQLVVNSNSRKLEGVIREKEIQYKADQESRAAKEAMHARELELLKTQADILRQNSVWLQGWQTTILNQKPGEPYGDSPTFNPDPATSTPQAMAQAQTLPLVATPLTDANLPPVVPLAPEVLKTGSGLLPSLGTSNAPIRENTEALKENTEAVRDVVKKL